MNENEEKATPEILLSDLKEQEEVLIRQIKALELSLRVIQSRIYWAENPSGSF